MNTHLLRRLVLPAAVLAAAPLAALPVADAANQEATVYNVDPVHTGVVFGITWNGMSTFWGKFNEVQGEVRYAGDPESLEVDVTILVPSIDTHNKQRDGHLLSPDYFDARQYPEITFTSTGITANDDGTFTLAGDLTLHGQTNPVEATVTRIESGETPRGNRTGIDAHFTINRSDFGMDTGVEEGALGDEVEIRIGLQSVEN